MCALSTDNHIKTHHPAVLCAYLTPQLIPIFSSSFPSNYQAGQISECFVIRIFYPLEHVWCAHRLTLTILLVAHQQQANWVIRGAFAKRIFHPNHISSDDGFHIRGTAPPQIVTFNARLELRIIRLWLNNVEMTTQHYGSRCKPWEGCQHRRVFTLLEHLNGQPMVTQIIIHQPSCPIYFTQTLIRTSCYGWNADQLFSQSEDFPGFIRIAGIKACRRMWAKMDADLFIAADVILGVLQKLTQAGSLGWAFQ